MLEVFICEDEPNQQQLYGEIVKKHIAMEELDMLLAMMTGDPSEILHYLDQNPKVTGVYFLDIDLNREMTGLILAQEIRKRDALGKIIFVTTHDELAPQTYRYKVEALDFIVKGSLEETRTRIRECLNIALERQVANAKAGGQIVIKNGKYQKFINSEDVLFFETTGRAHKLCVHTKNGKIEFYGSIKDMENHGEEFIRVHKSYVVNRNNIRSLDSERFELEMVNGQRCAIAPKKMRLLKKSI